MDHRSEEATSLVEGRDSRADETPAGRRRQMVDVRGGENYQVVAGALVGGGVVKAAGVDVAGEEAKGTLVGK